MDEIWVRLALLIGVVAVSLAVAWFLRRRSRGPVRRLSTATLAPGIHFFSSATCATCDGARQELAGAVGPAGFTEHEWSTSQALFAELSIDAVPAALVVEKGGQATLYSGDVAPALRGV